MNGQPGTCRSCGAAILWAYTEAGKRMPLDAAPTPEPLPGTFVIDGNTCRAAAPMLDPAGTEYRMNHFATCPQGESWSKGKRT